MNNLKALILINAIEDIFLHLAIFTLIYSNKAPMALTMRPSAALAERLRSRILRMMLSLLCVSLTFICNLFLCLPYVASILYCLWNCKGGSKTFTKKFTAHPSQADRRSGSHRAFLIDELLTVWSFKRHLYTARFPSASRGQTSYCPQISIVHNCHQYKFLPFVICEHLWQLSFVNNNPIPVRLFELAHKPPTVLTQGS